MDLLPNDIIKYHILPILEQQSLSCLFFTCKRFTSFISPISYIPKYYNLPYELYGDFSSIITNNEYFLVRYILHHYHNELWYSQYIPMILYTFKINCQILLDKYLSLLCMDDLTYSNRYYNKYCRLFFLCDLYDKNSLLKEDVLIYKDDDHYGMFYEVYYGGESQCREYTESGDWNFEPDKNFTLFKYTIKYDNFKCFKIVVDKFYKRGIKEHESDRILRYIYKKSYRKGLEYIYENYKERIDDIGDLANIEDDGMLDIVNKYVGDKWIDFIYTQALDMKYYKLADELLPQLLHEKYLSGLGLMNIIHSAAYYKPHFLQFKDRVKITRSYLMDLNIRPDVINDILS